MKKKLIPSELREGTGAVFLSEYPSEDDLKGWLKVHRDSDVLGVFTSHWHDRALELIESLRQQLAECQKELAEQKLLCVDDEMVIDMPAGFKHRIKFQCDMLPLTDEEFDDYVKSSFGIKNWIRKQLDMFTKCKQKNRELNLDAAIGRVPMDSKDFEWEKRLTECERERDELREAAQEVVNCADALIWNWKAIDKLRKLLKD